MPSAGIPPASPAHQTDIFGAEDLAQVLRRTLAGEGFAAILGADFATKTVFTRYERDRMDGETDFEGAWFERASAEAAQAASPQASNYTVWKLFIRETSITDLLSMGEDDRRKALRHLLRDLVARFPQTVRPGPGQKTVAWKSVLAKDCPAFLSADESRVSLSELRDLDIVENAENAMGFRIVEDGRSGFADRDGRVTLLESVEEMGDVHGGLAAVRVGGRWGLLRRDGTRHVSARFEEITPFYRGVATARLNGRWGLIDSAGETLLPFEFESIAVDGHDQTAWVARDGRTGLLGFDGTPIIEVAVTDPTIRFGAGVPWRLKGFGARPCRVGDGVRIAACTLQDDEARWGFLDRSGQVRVPLDYDAVMPFREDLAVVIRDGRYGVVDAAGRTVIPLAPYRCYGFSEGVMAVSDTTQIGGRWGYVDTRGRLAIDFRFTTAETFQEGLALVSTGGYPERCRYAFIDRAGSVVIPWRERRRHSFREGLAGAQGEEKWGYIDQTGRAAIGFQFDEVDAFRDGLARVRKDGRYGLINRKGKPVIPFVYDYLFYPAEGLVCAKHQGRYGYLDPGGKTVVPFDFEDAAPVRKGRALVKKNGFEYFLKTDEL